MFDQGHTIRNRPHRIHILILNNGYLGTELRQCTQFLHHLHRNTAVCNTKNLRLFHQKQPPLVW